MEVQMKVLWAFDPFAKNKELNSLGKKVVNIFFSRKDILEVLYIASNAEVELATAFNIPLLERYSNYPKKIIKDELKRLSLKKVSIEVIIEKTLSLTSSVKKLVNYSKKNHTDIILVATNEKRVFSRFVLGSFTETLIHLSVCDLLVYHQHSIIRHNVKLNIVYAHDFSLKGQEGLERIVVYAKKWDASITVVHISPFPDFTKEKQWLAKAQKLASKVDIFLNNENIEYIIKIENGVLGTSKTIVDIAAKTEANLIAVCSQSNKLSVLAGGSTTRQLLRESMLPVLILKV
jgi:nucleotide-binding universal stress UspA family protein